MCVLCDCGTTVLITTMWIWPIHHCCCVCYVFTWVMCRSGHYLAKIEDQIGLSPAVFNLLNMLMQVLFIAHMVACVWWGMSSTMAERGWMDNVLEREGGGDNVRIATVCYLIHHYIHIPVHFTPHT